MDLIAIVVSILTLVIAAGALVVTIRQFKKQLHLNFFSDYTKRYQEIILNLPLGVDGDGFKISDQPEDVRDKTLRYMRAYFDLCSEEYFLWRNGDLDKKTWKEWEAGIMLAFSKPAFKEAWETLNLDTIYYSQFSDYVSEIIPTQK